MSRTSKGVCKTKSLKWTGRAKMSRTSKGGRGSVETTTGEGRAMTRTQTATGALDINRLKTRLAQLRADRSSFIVDNAGVVAQATNALMQYNQILSSLDGRIAELEGFLNEEQKRSDDGDE